MFTPFLLALVLTSPVARAKLVVAHVNVNGSIEPAIVAALEDAIASEAAIVSDMDVMSPASVQAALSLRERQMLAGCSGAECFKAATSMLTADELLSVSLQRLPDSYSLTIERIDVKATRSLKRASQVCKPDAAALLLSARSQTAALFGVAGRIALWNQPADAEVYVDGRLIGRTPVSTIKLDSPGLHVVSLTGPSITPWRTEIEVNAGTELRLRSGSHSFAELEQQAYTRRNAGIGVLVTSVAIAGAAAALWAAAVGNDRTLDQLDLRTASQAQLDGITGRTAALTGGAVATSAVSAALIGMALWLIVDNPAKRELAQNGVLLW